MGRIQIDWFEVRFDEQTYKTWDKDEEIVVSVMSDWYEDNTEALFLTMEPYDGGYNFTLHCYNGKDDYGSMDKWMNEEFTLAKLQKEIFEEWVDEHKDDAIVIRTTTEKKKKRKI